MNKKGNWKAHKTKVKKRREKSGLQGGERKEMFKAGLPFRLFSPLFFTLFSIFFLCFLSLLSVCPSSAYCSNSFLSAVCSAWHSVWKMMAIPEEGGNTICPHQSQPAPSSHHSLYTTTVRPIQHRGEREGVPFCCGNKMYFF